MFATNAAADLFANTSAVGLRPNPRQPSWKVILGLSSDIVLPCAGGQPAAMAGAVFPPGAPCTQFRSNGHVTLWVNAWQTAENTPRQTVFLNGATVRRILDALGSMRTPDLDEGRRVLIPFLGPERPLDPRLLHAFHNLTRFPTLKELANEVQLSPPRLRYLVRETVGVPLTQLRHWARLRNAFSSIDQGLAVAAQRGEFADQPHFTRLTHQLFGSTPSFLSGHDGRFRAPS